MRVEKWKEVAAQSFTVETISENLLVCILAGGRSLRMGCDKSQMVLGGQTFLERIESTVQSWNSSVQVELITEDLVEKCGPIGGVLTAISRFKAGHYLFLSCDMPFISPRLLQLVIQSARSGTSALFCRTTEGAGFPFLLSGRTGEKVQTVHAKRRYSLQNLARELEAVLIDPTSEAVAAEQLMNINTPEDFLAAKAFFEKTNPGR